MTSRGDRYKFVNITLARSSICMHNRNHIQGTQLELRNSPVCGSPWTRGSWYRRAFLCVSFSAFNILTDDRSVPLRKFVLYSGLTLTPELIVVVYIPARCCFFPLAARDRIVVRGIYDAWKKIALFMRHAFLVSRQSAGH